MSDTDADAAMNSLMHGFDDGQSGSIRISAKTGTDSLISWYSDNGKGIYPEVRGRLFEPFFTAKKGQGGTGLGCYLIRQELVRRDGANHMRRPARRRCPFYGDDSRKGEMIHGYRKRN